MYTMINTGHGNASGQGGFSRMAATHVAWCDPSSSTPQAHEWTLRGKIQLTGFVEHPLRLVPVAGEVLVVEHGTELALFEDLHHLAVNPPARPEPVPFEICRTIPMFCDDNNAIDPKFLTAQRDCFASTTPLSRGTKGMQPLRMFTAGRAGTMIRHVNQSRPPVRVADLRMELRSLGGLIH